MDLPARARPHLLLRVLLADFSDSPTEWPTQNSSGIRISGGRFTRVRGGAVLVRTDVAMVFEWLAHADGAVLGWYRGCPAGSCKCVAGRYVGGCFACFLSFVSAADDFSSYQSDGMLLEAGFISLFFVPGGLFPGWGNARLPPHPSVFLLRWGWFRIYFESGVVKTCEWR